MWLFLFFIIVIHFSNVAANIELGDIALGCPLGAYRHRDYCYSQAVVISTNFHAAQLACASQGGSLAMVRDEETQRFLQRLNIRKYQMDYWIGMTDQLKEGDWVFSDGSHLGKNFDNWYPGEPNNHATLEHCAYMWISHGLKWNDDKCDKKRFYACQFQAENCPNTGNIFRQGHFCFLLSTDQASFAQASTSCKVLGGTLAVPNDKETHEALVAAVYEDRSWKEFSQDNVTKLLKATEDAIWMRSWIGVSRSQQGRWQYLDGTSVSFRSGSWSWGSGSPGSGKCVASARYWYTAECSGERGFTCQFKVHSAAALSHFKSSTASNAANVSIHHAVFWTIVLLCILLGAGVAVIVLKRHVLTRQIQKLRQKTGRDDDTSVTFTALENSDVA